MQEYLTDLKGEYFVYFYISKDVIEKHFEEHKTWINLTFLIGWKDGRIENMGEFLHGRVKCWHPLMKYAEPDFVVESDRARNKWLNSTFYLSNVGTFTAFADETVPIDQFVIEGDRLRLKRGTNVIAAYLNHIHKGYAFVELYCFNSLDIIHLPKVAIKSCKNT